MHSGIAIAFTVSVSKHDVWGTSTDTDPVTLVSSNPEVLEVASVPPNKPFRWIIWGVAPGSAVVTLSAAGNVAASIPVTVSDPPE